ncbi:MAG: hypothetical protein AAF267_20215, partial [Deinococcota bacterium]
MLKQNSSVRSLFVGIALCCVCSTNAQGTTNLDTSQSTPTVFYALPDDWHVTPIEQQHCLKDELRGSANVYTETASKLFVWLTGTVDEAHYEPIGEIANYFGFAALRTEIRARDGAQADTSFRGTVYKEILELLDTTQRALLYELLDEHRPAINGFLNNRILFIDELWRLKDNHAIDFDRVSSLINAIGEYEATITVLTAQYYAQLLPTLSDAQMQYLQDIRTGAITAEQMRSSSLPYATEAKAQYDALSESDAELITEVASKLIAWVTGDVDDAVFLPPGKIGNFFGFSSYRYVDRTAVSRGATAAFVDQVLTPDQQAILCGLSINVIDYTNHYI